MSDRAKLNFLQVPEGACPECGAIHHPSQPHKWGEEFYMHDFFEKHGVYPSWGDALAHCREDVRNNWRGILLEAGVTSDQLVPNKPKEYEHDPCWKDETPS